MAIIRNSIICNHCGEELDSTYVHDFNAHTCEGMQKAHGEHAIIACDGGLDYLRRVGHPDDYKDNSKIDNTREFASKSQQRRYISQLSKDVD